MLCPNVESELHYFVHHSYVEIQRACIFRMVGILFAVTVKLLIWRIGNVLRYEHFDKPAHLEVTCNTAIYSFMCLLATNSSESRSTKGRGVELYIEYIVYPFPQNS